MEPTLDRERMYQLSQPRFDVADFYIREDDTDLASEGEERWTDAREGRDELGGY